MAPGVRSGRRTGHPKVLLEVLEEDPGGRSDAGAEGRCLRSRCRAGAAGMLGNCALSVGMLLLVVRCALAAEEKHTYDASGSSSLPSDPAVTAASAHPLADLSVVKEVPFSVVHSDGDSESAVEGLPGQPAFSSVLTVMAGTVKHPMSLDRSRTLPTITRDDAQTTQWPSHSSSQGSEMSSSSSSSGVDRILPASSGLTFKMSHQHSAPTQAVADAWTVSHSSRVSSMDGNVSVFPSSTTSSSLLPSVSPSTHFTSSVLSSSVFASDGGINKFASSQGQTFGFTPALQTETATLSPARSLGWTNTQSNTQSVDVTQGLQSSVTRLTYFPSKSHNEKNNKVTKHSFYSAADTMLGVMWTNIKSRSTDVAKTPAISKHTSYPTSPDNGGNLLKRFYGPTQTQSSVSDINFELGALFHSIPESQAIHMQQGATHNPRSYLLSVDPKGYSASSHVAEQPLTGTPAKLKKQQTAGDSQAFAGSAIMLPPGSHIVNPTVSPAFSFRPYKTFFTASFQPLVKTSLSEAAITQLTHIRSGMVSSEHASNPGDLLMAAGHRSPRVPAININYSPGEMAGTELKSISTQAHLNNSLSPTQASTNGQVPRLFTRREKNSSKFESESHDLPSDEYKNVQDFITETGSPLSQTEETTGRMMPTIVVSSHSGTILPSGSIQHQTSSFKSDSYKLTSKRFINVQDFVPQTGSTKGLTQETTGWTRQTNIVSSHNRTLFPSGSSLDTTSSTTKSDSNDLPTIGVKDVQDFVTHTESPMGLTMKSRGWMTPTAIVSSHSRTGSRGSPQHTTSTFESDFHDLPSNVIKHVQDFVTQIDLTQQNTVWTRPTNIVSTHSRTMSPSGSPLGTTPSTFQSDTHDWPTNGVINVQDFVTQTESPTGLTMENRKGTEPKITVSSHSRTMSTSGFPLATTSSMSESGDFPSNRAINVQGSVTQTQSLVGLTMESRGWTRPTTIVSFHSRKVSPSGSSLDTTSSTFKSNSHDLPTNGVIKLQDFITHTESQTGLTMESRGWMMPKTKPKKEVFSHSKTISPGSSLPVTLANDMTNKNTHKVLSPALTPYLFPSQSHSPDYNTSNDNTSQLTYSKGNNEDQSKPLSPAVTPSQRPFLTRSLLSLPNKFYTKSGQSSTINASHQTVSSEKIPDHIIVSGRGKISTISTISPLSDGHMTQGHFPAMNIDRQMNANEESTLIRHTVLYKQGAPSVQYTTEVPSVNTMKDPSVFDKNSEVSAKESPTEIPLSRLTSDAALESIKGISREDDVTLMSHHEQSSHSWKEIMPTPRTYSAPRSQGPIISARSDKSLFYSGGQTAFPSTAFLHSESPPPYSDGQNSHETSGAIFSFGTKLMAPYKKWKTTKPVSFQSLVFDLETTSIGFDWTNYKSQTDGPSYNHPKQEGRQEPNVHILSSTDPTTVTNDPYFLYATVGDGPSLKYIKGTSVYEDWSQNLFPANLRSAATVKINQGATVSTDDPSGHGSDGSVSLSHIITDSVTSSQDSLLAFVYKGKHNPSVTDIESSESALDAGATLSNSPLLNITDIENIKHITHSKLKQFTRPTEVVPSSLESSPLTYSSSKASQLSLQISVSSKTSSSLPSSLSISPTIYPSTAPLPLSLNSIPAAFPSSSASLTLSVDPVHSEGMTQTFVVLSEAGTDDLTAGTSRTGAITFPKEKVASLAPSQSVRITLSDGPTERTSQESPLSPQKDTTTASVEVTTTTVATATKTMNQTTTMPSLRITTQSATTTTTSQPTPVTRRTTTTTTIRTQTSRRIFTPPVPRTSPPRTTTTIFLSPFTTTTEAPPQQCNITERLWVKTVVSIYVRRNRLDSIQRQNLRRGLSQGLRKALNDSSAQAQVETVFGSPNMTVAYHVTGGDMVYIPSVILEGLDSYGRDKLIADLRQYLPMVTALPLPVTSWRSIPATGFQLKTVLQFVGAGDDPRSCRFSQMMEQRLEKVFSEAQAKVLKISSRLSVQMLSISQAAGSPAVSLVYTVKNGTVFLNGTTASNLLGQLSAELVGYFLFYPPLIIAEPLEYHNLNTSIATRDYWVITVIQDVDNASLEGQYQSFASLMEQRLAELFVLAGQQGTRFRRATAVDSYTVQMVSIRRVSGLKNPAEMTYYVQHNGIPISGTSAAKVLNTVDSQTMALTLGYFVQLQAEPVVKNPPNNLWILAAVLAPIAVVTLIIIIITAVLCRKNKNDFKADAIGNLNPRAKMAYRRDVGYYHQPVQGFDYAKQHLGQQGGDEETLPASQDTLVMSLQIRDTPLSLEKALQQDGTASKRSLTSDKHKSKLPSEDGSVISNESEKLNSGRALTVLKVTAQQKLTKEETRKRDDPYDTSSGSLQLISIKPMAAQPNYSHPASSDRSQESAIVNGEVNLALKQKSDIEHYRNKLRLKAKRKGYYDVPSTDGSGGGQALSQRQRHGHERAAGEHGRPLEPDDERGSTYVKSHRRHSQVGQTAYRSRQSLSSPSPGGTEMDLLVMRERPRRGIRNSGYDTEPELIEETNVDRLMGPRGYMYGRGLKGHSETSTLSSQPSIDEVRQQMHLLLEEAFSLASGGQSTSGRHSHHHHPPPDHYNPGPPPLPYVDVVTSAPGTMTSGRGGLQWVPSYGSDVYQCSLPKPAFHFTQLPEMAMGSPPPLPPRTGPPPGTSLRRSTSDLGPKGRSSEKSVTEMQSQHDNNPYGPVTRAALPSITAEQPVSNYSGNPITAVYAIPASRPGYSEYFVSTPPTSYHSPSWMSYPPEPEDVPPQWADSLPLPGYVEAFPHPRYPQGSPTRLPLEYSPALEPPPAAPSTASQQSLPQVVKDMDSMPLSSLSTSALVQAIRQEVAKLAKKQNDVFEF